MVTSSSPLLLAIATLLIATTAGAQMSPEELAERLRNVQLQGGAAPTTDAGTDDGGAVTYDFPGPSIEPRAARPAGSDTWSKACSFRRPLCVHADARSGSRPILAVLAAAERAWDTITGVLKIPAPDPDLAGAFHVYLVDDVVGGGATFLSERDARARFDRASAFTIIDKNLSGCALDAVVTREVARASLYRVAPATDDGSARAATTYLAHLVAPCPIGDDAVAIFQRYPHRAIVDPWRDGDARFGDLYERGASLFFWWLDAEFGVEPGAVVRGLWALAPTTTSLGASHFRAQPDSFDVLRMTFKGALGALSSVDDLLVRFAVARAFFGAADDGEHLAESRTFGEPARLRLDWEVAWPEKPRRFACPNPIAPTAASYVAIRRANAPKGSSLAVKAEWEEHARMRWVVVKIDAKGAATSVLPVTGLDRATEAELTVTNLDDTATILVVGVNVGDAARPFDPDDEIWEPHGWLLQVHAE